MTDSKKNKKKREPLPKVAEANESIKNTETPAEETPEILTVTNASEWRNKNINIRLEKLPSGMVVVVQNVSLQNLTAKGAMPLTLLTHFMNLQEKLKKLKSNDPSKIANNMESDDLLAFTELCEKVCLAAIVEPKITETDTGEDDAIPISEIEFEDKTHIFEICIRGGALPYAGFSG